MAQSWKKKPYVAMRVYDAIETPSCPAEHPEDLTFDIWLGTRGMCDFLERPGERTVRFNKKCAKQRESSSDASEHCYDVVAIAPIIFNTFKGVRYCGRQSELAFKDMERPVKGDDDVYRCPKGFKACNEEFF